MATAKTKLAELIHGIKPYRAKKREQYMNDDQREPLQGDLKCLAARTDRRYRKDSGVHAG
ncbi:MAG: hypothetical protein Ct9H300mP14_11720 [Gammaproteobacteria bacterium]|nr:MAG: hypothetical protein Ct9H300mP14_11720 [Gammaproteobacteria bacterium]